MDPLSLVPLHFQQLKELRNGSISYIQVIRRDQTRPPVRQVCRKMGVTKLSDIPSDVNLYEALLCVAQTQAQKARSGAGGGNVQSGQQSSHGHGMNNSGQGMHPGANPYGGYGDQGDYGLDNDYSGGGGGSGNGSFRGQDIPMPGGGGGMNVRRNSNNSLHSGSAGYGGDAMFGGGVGGSEVDSKFQNLVQCILSLRNTWGPQKNFSQAARQFNFPEQYIFSVFQRVCEVVGLPTLDPTISTDMVHSAMKILYEERKGKKPSPSPGGSGMLGRVPSLSIQDPASLPMQAGMHHSQHQGQITDLGAQYRRPGQGEEFYPYSSDESSRRGRQSRGNSTIPSAFSSTLSSAMHSPRMGALGFNHSMVDPEPHAAMPNTALAQMQAGSNMGATMTSPQGSMRGYDSFAGGSQISQSGGSFYSANKPRPPGLNMSGIRDMNSARDSIHSGRTLSSRSSARDMGGNQGIGRTLSTARSMGSERMDRNVDNRSIPISVPEVAVVDQTPLEDGVIPPAIEDGAKLNTLAAYKMFWEYTYKLLESICHPRRRQTHSITLAGEISKIMVAANPSSLPMALAFDEVLESAFSMLYGKLVDKHKGMYAVQECSGALASYTKGISEVLDFNTPLKSEDQLKQMQKLISCVAGKDTSPPPSDVYQMETTMPGSIAYIDKTLNEIASSHVPPGGWDEVSEHVSCRLEIMISTYQSESSIHVYGPSSMGLGDAQLAIDLTIISAELEKAEHQTNYKKGDLLRKIRMLEVLLMAETAKDSGLQMLVTLIASVRERIQKHAKNVHKHRDKTKRAAELDGKGSDQGSCSTSNSFNSDETPAPPDPIVARQSAKILADGEMFCKIGDKYLVELQKEVGLSHMQPQVSQRWEQLMVLRSQLTDIVNQWTQVVARKTSALESLLVQLGYFPLQKSLPSGDVVLSFDDEDSPVGTAACTLLVGKPLAVHRSRLLQSYIQLDKSGKITVFISLIIEFARSQGFLDKLDVTTWTVLGLHFLLRNRMLPNVSCNYSQTNVPPHLRTQCGHVDVTFKSPEELPAHYATAIQNTSLILMFYSFVKYFATEVDISGTIITLRGNGEVVPKSSWNDPEKAKLWRLSVEDPFEFAGSNSEVDLCAELSADVQREVFVAFKQCVAALGGIISSTEGLEEATIHELFNAQKLLEMATSFGYVADAEVLLPPPFPSATENGGAACPSTDSLGGGYPPNLGTGDLGAGIGASAHNNSAYFRKDSEFTAMTEMSRQGSDYSFSEYYSDVGSTMGSIQGGSIQGSFYTDPNASHIDMMGIGRVGSEPSNFMRGVLDDGFANAGMSQQGAIAALAISHHSDRNSGRNSGRSSVHDRLSQYAENRSVGGASESDAISTGNDIGFDDNIASLAKDLSSPNQQGSSCFSPNKQSMHSRFAFGQDSG